MKAVSCAVCVRLIDGEPIFEPIGRDDALVPVCKACATKPVIPKHRIPHTVITRDPPTPRAVQIREHRDALAAQGICIYGESHGPATSGKLCAKCRAKQQGRHKQRTEAA